MPAYVKDGKLMIGMSWNIHEEANEVTNRSHESFVGRVFIVVKNKRPREMTV